MRCFISTYTENINLCTKPVALGIMCIPKRQQKQKIDHAIICKIHSLSKITQTRMQIYVLLLIPKLDQQTKSYTTKRRVKKTKIIKMIGFRDNK